MENTGEAWSELGLVVGLDTQGQARRGTRSLTLTHRGMRRRGGKGGEKLRLYRL